VLTIQLDSPLPIVDQIRLGIRQAIAAGALVPGDALPTVRQLAADLDVNLNTVARAYRELEAEGLVTTVRGRGTTVAAARERRREPERQRRERLLNELRTLLASARLAGLSRAQIETLFAEQASAIWPEE
jgi:DNA-binding transcriptional regulator YhcF (GntR family)